jgi:ATPase subunit of ABC transporter with duplicated ATPase domains
MFVRAIRAEAGELEKLGIKGAQATNLIDVEEALARELEELGVSHAVEVSLDITPTAGTREPRKMGELSKGQRTTAFLLLLLRAPTAPLVINQPEDDLDNRFVYYKAVAHLRKLNGVR